MPERSVDALRAEIRRVEGSPGSGRKKSVADRMARMYSELAMRSEGADSKQARSKAKEWERTAARLTR